MHSFNKKQYIVYSRLSKHKKRVNHSIEVITKAFDIAQNWCISCSGGKDSVAMTYLINSIRKTPVFSYKDDLVWPGESEYLQGVANKFFWDIEISQVTLWPQVESISKSGGTLLDVLDLFSESFWRLIWENNDKYEGAFIGMRAEESRGRKWNYCKRGDIYEMQDGYWHSVPLARWEACDVFAYLVSNDIPIFSLYTDPGMIEPEKRREGWFVPGGEFLRSRGALVSLRYSHPCLFEKLADLFPEVRYES